MAQYHRKVTRSKLDDHQPGCEACNTVAEELQECKKRKMLLQIQKVITILLEELTQVKEEMNK
jgi:hypothetical protein